MVGSRFLRAELSQHIEQISRAFWLRTRMGRRIDKEPHLDVAMIAPPDAVLTVKGGQSVRTSRKRIKKPQKM